MTADLKILAKDWGWLIDLDHYRLLTISPFGDLPLQDDADRILLLDINLGAVEAMEEESVDPAVLFPMSFDDRIAAGYRQAGLVLTEGKCYGYKKQCVAGGSLEPDNVYVATTTEYISFMGDFHYQIKDVPDGATIRLKAINHEASK
jgi:hypothetical protein